MVATCQSLQFMRSKTPLILEKQVLSQPQLTFPNALEAEIPVTEEWTDGKYRGV